MRKIVGVLIALIMSVPLIGLTAAPVGASTCLDKVSQNGKVLSGDDPDSDILFYVRIRFYDCGNYRVFRWVTVGYESHYTGVPIDCGFITDVKMNPGDVLGHNPGWYDLGDCHSGGDYHIYDWTNVVKYDGESGDRCIGSYVHVAIRLHPDWDSFVPQACF